MSKVEAYFAAYRGARDGKAWVIVKRWAGTWDAVHYDVAVRRSYPMGPFDTFHRIVDLSR